MRRRAWLGGLCLFAAASGVPAQDQGLSISAGARVWYTHWTTFSYYTPAGVNLALTQTSGPAKWVALPTVSLRYGPWIGSFAAFPDTGFEFTDGSNSKRQEFDFNVGYAVVPGLNLTLGYKKIAQRGAVYRYEPAGPVVGVSANAALAGAFSMYGAFGTGNLKTPQSGGDEVVKFEAGYRLTEVGVAWSLATGGGLVERWTVTAGHRVQVMRSRNAFGSQDGIDTTQGFTIGALAAF